MFSVELQDKVMQIDNSPPISSHKKAEEKNETESKPFSLVKDYFSRDSNKLKPLTRLP